MQTFNTIVLWMRLHSIIWMMAVFALIVIVTYWPGRRAEIERSGSIPFREE